MPQDDISALSAKVDFLLDEVKNLRAEMADMKSDFDRGRGALLLIKIAASLAVGGTTIWAFLHGMRP